MLRLTITVLLLVTVAGTLGAQASAETTAKTELAFWESIKDSSESELFRDYLTRFPNGQFVTIARVKLRTLGDTSVTPSPQPLAPTPTTPPSKPTQPASPALAVSVMYVGGDVPKDWKNAIGILYVHADRLGWSHITSKATLPEEEFLNKSAVVRISDCRYAGLSKALCFTTTDGRTLKISAVTYRLRGASNLPLPWANNTLLAYVGTVDKEAIQYTDQQKEPQDATGKMLTGCRDGLRVRYDPRLCMLDGNWPGNRLVFEYIGIKTAITRVWNTTVQ